MDDFDAIANANADWAANIEAPAASPAPTKLKDRGLTYSGNVTMPNGDVHSRYTFTWGGKVVFYAYVDLAKAATAPGYLADAISWHPIYITSPDGVTVLVTKGAAVVRQHDDGMPPHVDGSSVMSYVMRHAVDYIVKFHVA